MRRLKIAAIVASVVILPFVLAELINRRRFDEPFPFVLFATLWVMAASVAGLAVPLLRPVSEGAAKRTTRIVLLIALVAVFGRILIDQMPCFLGVPGCD
jgi:predicted membrane-bound mannosyltransferase